ncbi:MAG TPA: plastocyanin/azurin family copper-binding protein, partial [Chloroflexota bacterium]|nr:plastocyanin/azurin family copper-binding protein [Chloroflexota bacterium]
MKLGRAVGASVVALLLLSSSSGFAAPDMTSVNIVEPRVEAKWGYAPGTLRVQPGSWITWSNAGQDPHTVTAIDGSFDSGNLDPSEGFSWFFPDAGTFPYVCTLHPWMKGKVIVGDGVAVDAPPPT